MLRILDVIIEVLILGPVSIAKLSVDGGLILKCYHSEISGALATADNVCNVGKGTLEGQVENSLNLIVVISS